MKLLATECTFDESTDEDGAHVWFADRTQNPVRYFTLYREPDVSEESVYFERDDQKWGGYGKACDVELKINLLIITLDAEVAHFLDTSPVIEVQFSLPREDVLKLKTCLIAILGGHHVKQ